MTLSALSWPGTRLAKEHGCTCKPADIAGWGNEYGARPTIDCDAWCPVHGLEALVRDARR